MKLINKLMLSAAVATIAMGSAMAQTPAAKVESAAASAASGKVANPLN